jgi:hypothetical protein
MTTGLRTIGAAALVIAVSALALASCGEQQKKAEEAAPPTETIPALQWVSIAQTGDGGAVLYDPAQTKADAAGKFTDVVVRIRHPYLEGWAQDLPKEYIGEVVFQTEQATLRFDCAARAMGVVSREALGADGAALDRRMTPEPVALAPVRAGGVGEVVFPKVCAPATP